MTPLAPAHPLHSALLGWGLAAAVTLILAEPVRRAARRRGIVSGRSAERAGPGGVPLLGGAAVLAGLALGGWLACRADAGPRPWAPLAGLLAGLALLGLADDLRPLRVGLRLGLELGGSLLALSLALLPFLNGPVQFLPWAAVAAGAPALVFAANAFNMADNADGLAAGTGCLSFLGLGLALSASGRPAEAAWAWAASGALAGFLAWNRPPARLYLGDLGSLPLGALLALGLAAAGDAALGRPAATATPGASLAASAVDPARLIAVAGSLALIAGYLLFDPLYAILGRLCRGTHPWRGGRDHPSHDLAAALGGWPRALGRLLLAQALSVACGVPVLIDRAPALLLAPGLATWAILAVAARRGAR